MSAAEVAHRLRYAVATARERRRHRAGRLEPAEGVRGSLRPELRGASDWVGLLAERRRQATAFLAGAEHPETTRRVFAGRFSGELACATREAAAVRRHEISFFGETFRFGAAIPWHEDPCTGVEWPRAYHRDVPTGGGDVGFGDVKHVWELNRHQFLVDLAKHAFLSQAREDADAVTALRRDWRAAVPYATGASPGRVRSSRRSVCGPGCGSTTC